MQVNQSNIKIGKNEYDMSYKTPQDCKCVGAGIEMGIYGIIIYVCGRIKTR